MKQISVITGATGHIGHALVLELIAQGQRPRLLLRKPIPQFDGLDCDLVFGDITDRASLMEAFAGADVVYHLAGLIEVGSGNEDMVWRVNVDGTQNVIAACKACGVRRLVYASSVDAMPPAAAGTVMHEIPQYESGKVSGAYAKTKAVATQSVLNSACDGFEVVAGLPSACIGPYDFKTSAIGAMVRLCMRVKRRFPVTMNFGGYNFVDVRDVAQGLAACANPEIPSGASYLLTGEFHTVSSFVAMLSELNGNKAPGIVIPKAVVTGFAPLGGIFAKATKTTPVYTSYSMRKIQENGLFCYNKATRDLGYHPRSARESLADMIEWIRENDSSFS